MNEQIIILVLAVCIILLIGIVIYQFVVYQHSTQQKLKEISQSLCEILDTDSNKKVMVFTDNRVLIDLLGQINRILVDRQRVTANFLHSEVASKKMLSNISHDIKTPMTVILGYLEIMRMHSPEDAGVIMVEKKANQVMELINQFFTLAKIEAGDMDMTMTKINMNEICREAILDFYEILTQKNFQVNIDIPETTVFVQGNENALNRILFNLISNAVRYGGDGNYLGIHLHTDENWIYVDIVDHGKGIEKDFAANVFERLYTLEDSRNRKVQGNGLGLTIAKNLAVQMGGDIHLESIPNVKTTFTLQLKMVFAKERKK